jgi:hypothetical protein
MNTSIHLSNLLYWHNYTNFNSGLCSKYIDPSLHISMISRLVQLGYNNEA